MGKLLFVLLLCIAGVVALGFHRGWFDAEKTNDPETGRQGVRLEIDRNKINPDIEKVKEKIGGGGAKTNEKPEEQ